LDDEYYNDETCSCGVVYGPDGCIDPVREIEGLPKKIDMDKTVELFVKQVAERKFTTPIMVEAE